MKETSLLALSMFLSFAISCELNFAVCIDASTSINVYASEREFVAEYYQKLVEETGNQFIPTLSIVYATINSKTFSYGDKNQVNDVINTIKNVPRLFGMTNTAGCMKLVESTGKPNEHPTVLLVVTDGKTSDESKIDSARDLLLKNGYFIQAAGFGVINNDGLVKITGNKDNVITNQKLEDLTKNICDEMFPCKDKPSISNIEPIGPECENVKIGTKCAVTCVPSYKKVTDEPKCVSGGIWTPLNPCAGL